MQVSRPLLNKELKFVLCLNSKKVETTIFIMQYL